MSKRKTPRHGHKPIVMRYCTCEEQFARAGDFTWRVENGKRVLLLAIPRRGKRWCHSEWTIDHKNHCNAQWSWDGNKEIPTLKPSLHAVGIWHGWVRNGLLTEG